MHVNATSLLVIVATVIVVNVAVRTFSAHHADSAWAKGLSWVI
jgi:hypothetical protein